MVRTATNLKETNKIIVQNVKGGITGTDPGISYLVGRGGLIFDSENIIETLFAANYLFNNSSP